MDEAEDLADHVVVVDHGRVIAHGSVPSLVSSAEDRTLRLETAPGLDLRAALGAGFVVTEPRDGSYTVTGAVDPDAVAAAHRLARRARRAGHAADRRAPHPRGRLPRPDRTEPAMSAPASTPPARPRPDLLRGPRHPAQRRAAAGHDHRARAGARRAHAGHRDRARHRRRQPDRLPDARHPRAGGDDHVVHVAGHRLVVRPSQRRPAAALDHAAGPRRAARGQGARRPRRGGRAGRRHRRDRAAARLAARPGRASRSPWSRSCSGTAAFTSLALLVAGTLRAEAVLAVANLLLLVLAVAGGVIIPAEPAARGRWRTSPCCCRPARSARRCARP